MPFETMEVYVLFRLWGVGFDIELRADSIRQILHRDAKI